MASWSERSREERFAIIGAVAGMLIAGVVAFAFAFESSTFVRWAIMSVGLVAGYGVGRLMGRN
jgi:uncharacterized membrane protein